MAHILDEGTATATMWAIRFDGHGEIKVPAHRMQEIGGGSTFGAPQTFTFYDEENRVIFQAPRERVLYVRRLPDSAPPKPDDPAVFTLPVHMWNPGMIHKSLVPVSWREVFPGLQARFAGPLDGQASIDFRLTPEDGNGGH